MSSKNKVIQVTTSASGSIEVPINQKDHLIVVVNTTTGASETCLLSEYTTTVAMMGAGIYSWSYVK